MRAFTRTSSAAADPAALHRARAEPRPPVHPIGSVHASIVNSVVSGWPRDNARDGAGAPCGTAGRSYDFSRISIHAPRTIDKDKIGGRAGFGDDNAAVAFDTGSGAGSGSGSGSGSQPKPAPPAAPPKAKTAGVDSFVVQWSKNTAAGGDSPTNPRLRLDFKAKFKNDADHDPALADFRQNAMAVWEITDGPLKGRKVEETMHDDHYSRADADEGSATGVSFTSNDNPGVKDINKDDVLDYSFTAEQMIIDTSQAGKVIAKRGPHTATIKGKDPRSYGGVPKTLNS
ncbi:hypothetical protein [uncultured Bradyrhizobium sp.]|uniref:hypothetical protein n=1 Tax=uncultured Bradyrhizobium sp. TaxID=199684 RepID=UPI0035CC2178